MLNIRIRTSRSHFIPLQVDEKSHAKSIIDMLSQSYFFSHEPILIYHGKILSNFLSLQAQNVADGSEIILYEKGSLRFICNDQPLEKANKDEMSIIKTTPFYHKVLSIMNEVDRLEDQFLSRLESNVSENTLIQHIDDDSSESENKSEKYKLLTVLGPEPKSVSTEPLPELKPLNMYHNKPKEQIQLLIFQTPEEAGKFFASNSSTDWRW